jgi:hypothetical protein
LGKYVAGSIDDCGEGDDEALRSYAATFDLIQAQQAYLDKGTLVVPAFHTIKIDGVPACAAFNRAHPNPFEPVPTEEASLEAANKLNKFVEDIWEISPALKFIVETTAITKKDLDRVPALDPSNPLVSFQGCHLRAQAILVSLRSSHLNGS